MFPPGESCPDDGERLVRFAIRTDPFVGRELDGRYTILEKLGQGGMGSVYRAAQHSVEREVAVKVVNPHLISDHDVIRRFLREAKLASKLAHPHTVGVLDFGSTDDGVFFLVMELVVGRTLNHVVAEGEVFSPARVARIGMQICDALECAHALQIVHRDLKPTNIMLLSHGRDHVKVLDFGLAKSIAPDRAATSMTNVGEMLGTPAYMPPELALGRPCDGRADLYSLGCVLYELSSGRLPFESASPHELIAMHAHDRAPPLVEAPPPLAAVIERLLAKDPDERYPSAADTRAALEAALGDALTTSYPSMAAVSPAMTAATEAARSPRLRWIVVATGIVAVALVAVAVVTGRSEGTQPAPRSTALPQPSISSPPAAAPVASPLAAAPVASSQVSPAPSPTAPVASSQVSPSPPVAAPAPSPPAHSLPPARVGTTVKPHPNRPTETPTPRPHTDPVAVPTPKQAGSGSSALPF